MDNYQVGLEILTGAKVDKGSMNKAINIMDKMFDKLDFENLDVNVDTKALERVWDAMEKEADRIQKAFNELDLTMDSEQMQKELRQIEHYLDQLNDFDMSTLEKALAGVVPTEMFAKFENKIQGITDGLDVKQVQSEWNKLASEFEDAQKYSQLTIDTQKKALAQMALTGKKGSEAYNKLEMEIKESEQAIDDYRQALGEIDGTMNQVANGSFTDLYSKFEAITNLSSQIQDFSQGGLMLQKTMREVQARTGATAEEMEHFGEAAKRGFNEGVGESVADMLNNLGNAQHILGNFLDPQGIEEFTIGAGKLAQVFQKDINEVIAGSRTVVANFGLDGQEALELVAYAARENGGKMDDAFDTLDEYAQLARDSGMAVEEFFARQSIGMQLGTRDTDKIMDSLKEFGIRVRAGDFDKPMQDIAKAAEGMEKEVAQSIYNLGKQAQAGEITMNEAMTQTAKILQKNFEQGNIGTSLMENISVAMSGTMAEDIGVGLWSQIFSADIDTSEIRAKGKMIAEELDAAVVPQNTLIKFKKEFTAAIDELTAPIAPLTDMAGDALGKISQIAPALMAFKEFKGTAGNIVSMVKDKIAPAFTNLNTGVLSTGKGIKGLIPAVGGFGSAMKGLGAMMKAHPIMSFIAIATGAVALIDQFVETSSEAAERELEAAEAASKANDELIQQTQSRIDAINKNKEMVNEYDNLINKAELTADEEKRLKELMYELAEAYPGVITETNNHTESLTRLKDQVIKSNTELQNLNNELTSLNKEKINLGVDEQNAKVNKLADDLNSMAGASLLGTGLFETTWYGIDEMTEKLKGALSSEELQKVFDQAKLDIINNQELTNEEYKKKLITGLRKMYLAKGQLIEQEEARIAGLISSENQELIDNFRDTSNQMKNIDMKVKTGVELDPKETEALDELQGKYDAMIGQIIDEYQGLKEEGYEQNQIIKKMQELYGLSDDEVQKILTKSGDISAATGFISKRVLQYANQAAKAAEKTNDAAENTKKLNKEIENLTVSERIVKSFTDSWKLMAKITEDAADAAKDEADILNKNKKLKDDTKDDDNKSHRAKRSLLQILRESYDETRATVEAEKERTDYIAEQNRLKLRSQKITIDEIGEIDRQITAESKKLQAFKDAFKLELDDETQTVMIKAGLSDKEKDDIKKEFFGMLSGLQELQAKRGGLLIDLDFNESDLKKLQDNLERQELQFQIEVGIKDPRAMIKLLDNDLKAINKQISDIQDDINKTAADDIATREVLEQRKYNLQISALSKQKEIYSQTAQYHSQYIDQLEQGLVDELEAYDNHQTKLQETFDRMNNLSLDGFMSVLAEKRDEALKGLDDEEEKAMKKLEKRYEDGLISKEAYENKKLDIESKYADERKNVDDINQNAELLAEKTHQGRLLYVVKQAEIEKLNIKKKGLEDTISLIESTAKLDDFGDPILDAAAQQEYNSLRGQLETVKEQITTAGDEMNDVWQQFGDASAESITSAFAKGGDAFQDGARSFLGTVAGYLQQYASAVVSDLVLDYLFETTSLTPGSMFTKLFLAPTIEKAVSGVVGMLTNPVIQGLKSFATGGLVENPTIALVGDAGTNNPEWILNNNQMKKLLQESVAYSGNSDKQLVAEIRDLKRVVSELDIKFKLQGKDLQGSLSRTSKDKYKSER